MLEIDASVATELEVIFESMDDGEVVRIDGLENVQVKKKLRHLLKALKLTPVGSDGFKSPDRKVAFAYLFGDCLRRAHEKNAAENPAAVPAVVSLDEEPAKTSQVAPLPGDARAAAAGDCGEEAPAPPPEAPKPKRPRTKGPQLPSACIGAVEGSDDEASVESSDHDNGPRLVGQEREGVDLGALPKRHRDGWMTDAAGELGGLFNEAPNCGTRKPGSLFEIQRSKAEQDAYEKAMKARGGSLLEETRSGKFADGDSKQHVENMHKKLSAEADQWGMSEKQQDQKRAMGAVGGAGAPKAHRPFNPEEDMRQRKPMDAGAFSKFVEESKGELGGRFSRGQLTTSFL